jgi:hypothetical protein
MNRLSFFASRKTRQAEVIHMRILSLKGWIVPICCAICALFLLNPTASPAFLAPERSPLPNLDKRAGAIPLAENVQAEQRRAAERLQGQIPKVQVQFDPITGSPSLVSAREEFLSGPNGGGKAVLSSTASNFAGDPYGPAKAFLSDHAPLFGFGPEILQQTQIKREFVTAHSGLKTVVWEEQVDGIPLFEGVLIAHITSAGELVNISSQFVPDPLGAADRGVPNREVQQLNPTISATRAVASAARNLGEETKDESVVAEAVDSVMDEIAAAQQRQQFKADGLAGAADARLVWLSMSRSSLRLCWDVVLTSKARGEMFCVLVDAVSGDILLRHCLTDYISNVTYRVYTNDSPSPFSPGLSTPGSTQPPFVPRTLVTLPALDTNASPAGWIDDGGNETRGNNVDAHTDRNADNVPDTPRPQGSPLRVFDITMDPTNTDPTNYSQAAVVQLFYLCNFMHDKLYGYGFTEAAGNFQSNNFGRGGFGGDAVQADAQDGSGVNNANFSTPPDGQAGRMQMYIFTGPNPRRDGDLDAEVVLHEYTHGLSNRRVGGGVGISALQPSGMGEGWSDFCGMSMLSEAGDDVNGDYATGGYVTYLLSGMTQNYYFGIRRYPYTTDISKNPLTFKDIDSQQASAHTGIPISPIINNTANEVHNMGEVWCVTLWQARANLINKYGAVLGNQRMLQLVIDGMNLSPPNPTYMQARDGIIQADVVDYGGTNRVELWAAFAKRGMGAGATAPANSTTTGVHESFDLPDDLQILPANGFVANGPVGGPFTNSTLNLILTNTGAATFSWSMNHTSTWLNASPSSGTLNSAGPATPVNVSLNANTLALPMGIYTDALTFSNLTSGIRQTRTFTLRVGQPDFYTQLFDTETNDLAFQAFTFTPDGSASFYTACRDAATNFPTDPTGGTVVSLTDDSSSMVTLSGTNTISLYGRRTNVFFIGSNGYLTTGSGDNTYTETVAAHFSKPRISGWFRDFNPGVGGTISWKQLSDRVAVTYAAVPEFTSSSRTNSFQIEMFADGRIRITYLSMTSVSGLAGLSAGAGVPTGFQESDLTSYGSCITPLTVILPPSANEASGVLADLGAVQLASIRPTNLVVSLTSSVPARLTVPANVTIPAGQLSNSFNLTLINNSIRDGDQVVTVTASAPPLPSASSTIIVIDDDVPLTTLINFDDVVAPCAFSQTSHLTNQYAAQGVVFEGPGGSDGMALLNQCVGFNVTGFSPPNYLVLSPSGSFQDGGIAQGPETIRFNNAVSQVQMLVGSFYAADTVVTLQAYDGNNVMVGTTNITLTSIMTPVSLTAAAISKVIVTAPGGNLVIDDLSFSIFTTPPSITSQPVGVTARPGTNITLSVTATGTAPLAYQWRKNNTNLVDSPRINGSTTSTLTISNVVASDSAQYSVFITNGFGSQLSSTANLLISALDHFSWTHIASPQVVNGPFQVTLQARDIGNAVVSDYNGTVTLNATNGLVPLSPSTTSAFVQGIWNGSVMIGQAVSNLVISANDGLGHLGLANPINVIVPPRISAQRSNNTYTLAWPIAGSSGFVLESSPGLSPPVWTAVTNIPVQINGQNVLTLQTSGSASFYRLREPTL